MKVEELIRALMRWSPAAEVELKVFDEVETTSSGGPAVFVVGVSATRGELSEQYGSEATTVIISNE